MSLVMCLSCVSPHVSLLMSLLMCLLMSLLTCLSPHVSPHVSLSSCLSSCLFPHVSFLMCLSTCLSPHVSLHASLSSCLSSCVSAHVCPRVSPHISPHVSISSCLSSCLSLSLSSCVSPHVSLLMCLLLSLSPLGQLCCCLLNPGRVHWPLLVPVVPVNSPWFTWSLLRFSEFPPQTTITQVMGFATGRCHRLLPTTARNEPAAFQHLFILKHKRKHTFKQLNLHSPAVSASYSDGALEHQHRLSNRTLWTGTALVY